MHGDDGVAAKASFARADRDPDLAATLIDVGKGEPADPPLASTLAHVSGTSLGRFQILRPHAKGGLGQVSVALDQELNREVALKEILPRHADNQVLRERFVLEAEITGGLEHPGIVPVYALGQSPDGRPFYAVRFVKGDSLKEAIELFHKPDNLNRNEPGARQLALRQLLGRFIDVCNAMEYAHSRGVLHRDLKPGNVMVGKYGETLVVDWGLAKALGKREVETGEATLKPSSALSSSGQTQPGSAIGTPAYMSPEQAAGKLNELGPATDVYSLGATLYHLLCGKPPFEKQEIADIMAKVQRGDFPKPRAVRAEIHRGLEAICLKGMALVPRDRYATPRALADELEHWLADEPVAAAPDTLSDRLSRFARKYRGYVQAGAVAVMLIAVVSIASALLINEKSRQNATLADKNAGLVISERKALVQQTKLADEKTELAEKETRARRAAEDQTELANERLAKIRRGNYVARLALVSAKLDSDPSACLTLLLDEEVCPPESRDFVWRFYYRLARRDQVSWPAHAKRVTFLAFVPRLSAICSASADGRLNLWSQTDRSNLSQQESSVPITCGFGFADGETIATGDANGAVTLWKLPELTRRSFKLFDAPIADLTASGDGSLMAACGGSEVAVCDVAQGTVVQRHAAHESSLWSVALSADNRMLIAVGADRDPMVGCIRVFTGNRFSTVAQAPPIRQGAFTDVAVRGTSNALLLLTSTGQVLTFDLATYAYDGKPLPTFASGLALAATVDGKHFATSTTNGLVASSERPAKPPRLIDAESRKVTFNQLADDSRFHRVYLWKADGLEAESHLVSVRENVTSLTFSSDQQLLATGAENGQITVYDVRRNRERATLAAGGDVRRVWFSADGQYFTSNAKNKTSTWHLASLIASDPADERPPQEPNKPSDVRIDYGRSGNEVTGVSLSSDDRKLASSLADSRGVQSVSISPDGVWAAARRNATPDHTVIDVWDAHTGGKLYSVPLADADRFNDLWINSTQFVAVSSKENDTRIVVSQLDVDKRAGVSHEFALRGKPTAFPLLMLSPDRRLVAISYGDDMSRDMQPSWGEIVLWDVETHRERARLVGHRAKIWSLAFSPDCRVLATGSFDQSIKLWDTLTGAEMITLTGHRSTVLALSFSPDGKTLASGSFDETVRLWAAPDEDETLPPRSLFGFDADPFASAGTSDRLGNWGRSLADLLAQRVKITEQGKLADDNPNNLTYRRSAATMWAALASTELNLQLNESGVDSLKNSVQHFDALAAVDRLDDRLREERARALLNLGDRLNLLGRYAEASLRNQIAVDAWRALLLANPNRHDLHSLLGGCLNNLAMSKLAQAEISDARRLLEEAIVQQNQARRAAPTAAQYLRFLANHYIVLADVELAAGDISAVFAALEKFCELEGLSASDQIRLTQRCCLALKQLDVKAQVDPQAELEHLRNRLIEKALLAIRRARDSGFSDWRIIKQDEVFSAIRTLPEVQELVQDKAKK